MAPGETFTFNVGPATASLDPLTSALAVFILAAGAFLAWRRREFSPAQRVHGRWSRAAISSLFFAGSEAILLASENLRATDSFVVISDSFVLISIVGFVIFGVASFLLISVIEVTLWSAQPRRSRGWLAAAPIMFSASLTAVAVAVTLAFGGKLGDVVSWDFLQFGAIAVGTSLIWWSYLPVRSTEVRRLFE